MADPQDSTANGNADVLLEEPKLDVEEDLDDDIVLDDEELGDDAVALDDDDLELDRVSPAALGDDDDPRSTAMAGGGGGVPRDAFPRQRHPSRTPSSSRA